MKAINLVYFSLIALILSACGGGGVGSGGGGTPPVSTPTPIVNATTCTDSNAYNTAGPLPCICMTGYTVSIDGATCNSNITYTYYALTSAYLPTQSSTIACSGTVATSRTQTCYRSDNTVVSNSFCAADSTPNSSVASKSGQVAVTSTNPSLTNGTEYMTCSAGATTGSHAITCDPNFTITGSTLATQTCVAASYIATFNAYSPAQSATTPCSGTVSTSRSIATCKRSSDNVVVPNSNCSDSTPTSTVDSKAGTISVTPSNPSLVNGTQYMSCTIGSTSGSQVITCSNTYHLEGSTLSTQNCYSDTRSCSPMPTGVSTGTQTWSSGTYGSCVATACSTGYTLSAGTCSPTVVSNSLTFQTKLALLIQTDGTLKGWGMNEQSQLGQGDVINKTSSVTISVGTGLTTKKVVTNGTSTCAILSDSSVKCWGSNVSGQLGVGDTATRTSPTAVSLGSGKTAKDLIVGGYAYCAILNDNSLSCWGKNSVGQLGNGSVTDLTSPTTVNLGTGRTVVKVVMTKGSGNNTTCAILDDYSLKCWGYNAQGQVGDASTTDRSSPSTVSLGSGKTAKDVAFFSNTLVPDSIAVCATLNDDSLSCWGYNANGRLGVGDTANRSSPTAVSLGTGRTVKKMFGSQFGSMCVIMDDSNVKCWGKNDSYQIGDGTTTDRTSPTAVLFTGSKTIKDMILGNATSNCVIHTDSSLSCWGGNYRGQLGVGNSSSVTTPTAVTLPGSATVKSLSSSDYLSCLIATDGSVMCSGDNVYGSQGTGSASTFLTTYSSVALGSGKTAVELYTDNYGVCALLNDNSVKCWGYNEKGKLGSGAVVGSVIQTPTSVN